jgi:hypothetical protein
LEHFVLAGFKQQLAMKGRVAAGHDIDSVLPAWQAPHPDAVSDE